MPGTPPSRRWWSALESLYGVKTGLKTDRLYELSRLVEEISGVPIAANKALVGYNSFSHEAGIHTHGILAHTLTYEPLQPEVVGRRRQMIFGKHTGKAALVEKLKERNARPDDAALAELLRRIKETSEQRGKEELRRFLMEYRALFEHPGLSDDEFWKIVVETSMIPTEKVMIHEQWQPDPRREDPRPGLRLESRSSPARSSTGRSTSP